MNVDVLSSSSEDLSHSSGSSSSGESSDEFNAEILQAGEVLGYQFEPRRDSSSGSEGPKPKRACRLMRKGLLFRLGNLDW